MAQGVQLNNVAPVLLPPEITGPIFKKTAETSAVQQLARKVPLSVNAQTAIPVPMDVPTAGWIAEGGVKPVAAGGVGVKIMQGKKVALLLPVSQELAMTNAAGLYEQLQQDLPTAISRAFDYAAIHGLDLRTGAAGPFNDYLAMTQNSQVIGAIAQNAGGTYADLWTGVQKVINAPMAGYEFNGFAADPRLVPELALSVDLNGRPLFVDNSFNANAATNATRSLIGYPCAFNTGVSGKYYRQGNAVQTLTITATGGTYVLTIGGAQTSALAYNASAATIQSAIQAAGAGAPFGGNPAAVSATVSGTGPFTITLGIGAPVSINTKSLTGGTATLAPAAATDSGMRAIGGDWSQCAWGQGLDISIKVSAQASYTDGGGVTHSAFQENLILLLVEAYYGFVVNDPNAFVAYTHAAGS